MQGAHGAQHRFPISIGLIHTRSTLTLSELAEGRAVTVRLYKHSCNEYTGRYLLVYIPTHSQLVLCGRHTHSLLSDSLKEVKGGISLDLEACQ